jgi:4'-phosphopantetheinyl transferase
MRDLKMTARPNAATPLQPWTPAPPHPRLAPGAVHVWRADLAPVDEGELLALLSPVEHARAARLVRERDRQLWTRSHGVLRALLGRYLQTDPRTLRFAANAHGKPALLGYPLAAMTLPGHASAASIPPSFNLSHSGEIALYALTTAGPVGVDVEVARRPIDAVAIAARAFGPAEAARLRELDPETREREFLRAWVRHEAVLKCLGTGIAGAGTAQGAGGRAPWIAELEMGARAAAAVAVPAAPTELRCWDWSKPGPPSG